MSFLIIPCYIKTKWDIDCLNRLLKSVQNQTLLFEKVYFIDDSSPLDYQLDFSFIEYIKLTENGGPAKARNIGIDKALAENANYILFTDHDCILDSQWNEHMTDFLEKTRFGAVGGMTYSYGKTLYDYYHDINGTLNGKWLLPHRKELWYMPSLNFGMKSNVAKEFYFDERFPTAAGEDVDLCLRLRSKYKIGFCPKAKLWHDFGYKSTITGFKRFVRLFKKYKSSSATLYEGHTVLLWTLPNQSIQETLMSLIYKRRANQPSFTHVIYDYMGEIKPFIKRINKRHLLIPLVILKSIEWSIYRWYKTPIRRFYGVKGNELIYMITKRCNERCAKCGIWKTPEKDNEHIDISIFINCLKTLHENLYQVTITGGEPLLYKNDVLTIAEESRKHEIQVITVTNGVLITEDFLKQYAKLNHILVISIDTLEKEKWIEFRGNDTYNKVIENIKLSKKYLGNNFQIQSVLAAESVCDIPKLKTFCKELGIKHVIQPYMDFGGVWNIPKNENGASKDFACAARKNICIYPNGDVVKCFDHRRILLAKEPLGNIAEEDIIQILCKKRSTEVSKIMKTCNLPCKYMSCNVPEIVYN